MNIQLPSGKTVSVSYYQFLFELQDEDVDEFYQSCMADDLGRDIENPFSNRKASGRFEIEEITEDDNEEEQD